MRITILQGAFFPIPPILGGAVEKMWYSLGKAFAAKGHKVFHISRQLGELPEFEEQNGVQHIRVKGYDTPKSGLVLKLRDFLYTRKALHILPKNSDILVSNTFWAPILLPDDLKRVCFVDVQRMPKGQMKYYNATARLRANSTPVADAIRNELPESKHAKVVMIPNPLPFVPLEGVDILKKKKVILYTGRVHPEKGLDLLIKAFKQTDQSYHLQIVGPWEISAGGGGDAYINYLRQLASNYPVDFVGPVFNTEALNSYYKEASIFVYPSVAEQGETFGLAPLEAMAWGCVPVVSNLSCSQDFIQQNQNGLIFDHRSPDAVQQLAYAISQLQVNAEWRTNLSQQALTVRHTHSISRIADLFLDDFEQIIQQTS